MGATFEPTAELVRQIERSELRSRLFAWTSVLELCVVSVPVAYPYSGPYLSVQPIGDAVCLRYVDTGDTSRQWTLTVQARDAYAALRVFCREMCWG